MDVKVRRHTNQKRTPCNIHTSFIPIEMDLRAGSQPSGTGGLPASPPLQQQHLTWPRFLGTQLSARLCSCWHCMY